MNFSDVFAKRCAENVAATAHRHIQSGLEGLRDPKPSVSSINFPASSSFQVYEQVIGKDGVSESMYTGDTDWDTIYKQVSTSLNAEDDAASEFSEDEYMRSDTYGQEDEDGDDDEDDDADNDAASMYS